MTEDIINTTDSGVSRADWGVSAGNSHFERCTDLVTKKGKKNGQESVHFKCLYCPKKYQGPSTSAILRHLRSDHPTKCADLTSTKAKPARSMAGFFDKRKIKMPFDADVFMGLLLKWIVKTDQPFSSLENEHFKTLMEYLKNDITFLSRRTRMKRLDELYEDRKGALKEKLNSFNSKYSITCDVWTSKNQLSFFGFTIHYIDDKWEMQEGLIAFKHLNEQHDGLNLSKAMMEVLEDLGIADRLLGVTADNASNNSTMMVHLEKYYTEHYPEAGFSVAWNQVECMAHVLNLGAQQLLKAFKQPVEKDTYEAASESSDKMVTAISRLSFIVRKIRLSPKMRQSMKDICEQKGVKFLVPTIDVSTRWNSTYDMLVRADDFKEIISDTVYATKDRCLVNLLLKEDDWKCIKELITILKPFKEITLMVSQEAKALSVTHVIPLFHFCTQMLKDGQKRFDPADDIFIGLEAAIEKLEHYYDKISPMVGIALMLDPRMKKDILKNDLGWTEKWMESVSDHFANAFTFYQRKLNNPVQQSTTASSPTSDNLFYSFLSNKRLRRSECAPDKQGELATYIYF